MKFRVAILSFAAVYLLYLDYLPPRNNVHFFGDIGGYHYPLINYAHKAIREGRIPEWDHTIYSGSPFAGNIQAGLFYPPNWLIFFANRMHSAVRFKTIQGLEVLHYWLAFLFAYLWLRERTDFELPAIFGGAVFGLTGYPVAEAQHLGVVCGHAWIPFGLWGLDQFQRSGDWRKLWKTALGSAMCLCAGYPAHWVLYCVTAVFYGLGMWNWRAFVGASGALAFSLGLAAVQLGPALESTGLKTYEPVYLPLFESDWRLYRQFVVPNYFENAVQTRVVGDAFESYFYLGSPGLAGLLWLAMRPRVKGMGPALGLLAGAVIVLLNPFDLTRALVYKFPVLPEVMRGWNLIAILPVIATFCSAVALNEIWKRRPDQFRPWAYWATCLEMAAWAARLLYCRYWMTLATGSWSAAEAGICILIFLVGAAATRSGWTARFLLLTTVGAEIFAYGVGRRFNAVEGFHDEFFKNDARTGGKELMGVDNAVYAEILKYPTYRLAIDFGLLTTDVRHYGLNTPQGFDPFLSRQYKEAVEKFVPFETNRLFRLPLDNDEALQRFAVKFVLVRDETDVKRKLLADPRFRLLEPSHSFYVIFEYLPAQPVYRYPQGKAVCPVWKPELRSCRATGPGGEFRLHEQLFPGWEASIDGKAAPIERTLVTFQAVKVPPGEHTVEFRYRSKGLRWGALISALSLITLIVFAKSSRASRGRTRLQEL